MVISKHQTTDLQKGLLFDSSVSKLNSAYIVQRIFTLNEVVNEELLLSSWETIINRHEGIKAFFTQDFEEICIVDNIKCSVFKYDLSEDTNKNVKEKEAHVKEIVHRDSQEKFILTKPPLIRFILVKVELSKYYFVWSYHHVLMSGLSAFRIMKEAFGLYDAKKNHIDFELEPSLPYSEQVTLIKSLDNKDAEKYWKTLLSGYEGSNIFIPCSITNNNISSSDRQGIFHFYIDSSLCKKLKIAAKAYELTENTFIYAAWGILISCYLGATDISFGAVRIFPSILDNHIGLLMNTLPIRVKISVECSVIDFLRNIRNQYKAIRNFITTPLSKLREFGGVSSDRPIFETVVDFKPISLNQHLKTLGKQWRARELRQIIDNNYSLLLEVCGEKNKLSVEIIFNKLLFNEATLKQMSICFKAILNDICSFPEKKVSEVNVLNDAQKNRLLIDWNRRKIIPLKDKTIHELFEEQVEKRPNNIAIVFENEQLTYEELNRQSNEVARCIRKKYKKNTGQELSPDTLITLCLDRSIEMIVSILGVLKAGGAYVPIDPNYPDERIEFILKDTNSIVLITQQHISKNIDNLFKNSNLSNIDVIVIDKETVKDDLKKESAENLPLISSSADLAYIIYTSGTTGKSKGVKVTHSNVARLFSSTNDYYQFNDKDVWTLFHSYSFDFAVWELWGAISYGGKLVIPTQLETRDIHLFYKLCQRYGVTVLSQTPAAFYQFIDFDLKQESLKGKLKKLRYVIFGGDVLKFYRLKDWIRKYGDKKPKLVNMYGITETTVHVTLKEISKKEVLEDQKSNIGKPLADLKAYILDSFRNPVPIGVIGELYIGGAGLARGYLNRPELTKERFVNNPFATEEDKARGYTRLYKTGDLVRWLPDGNLEYIGRNDFQVKIRGFRIELGEIENTLSKIAGIKQVTVQAKDRQVESENDQYLVAYYVAEKSAHITQDEITNYLSRLLPEYMIPSFFVELAELPLTINGKIDSRALPNPEFNTDIRYVAPTTDLERQLSMIWKEVLGVERVGVTDDFFRIGGNSLLLVRTIHKISQTISSLNFSFSDIFLHRTIKNLLERHTKKIEMVDEGEI